MNCISRIRRSLTARITLWVFGFASIIMLAILLLMVHFTHSVCSSAPDYGSQMVTAVLIAIVGLAVLLLLCWRTISHYLHPLDLLAASAQRIAAGEINGSVGEAHHQDEVGQLQNSFAKMQQALAEHIAEMKQKSDTLNKQNMELEAAYEHAREADGVKAQFLNRMTAQMSDTVEALDKLTLLLCDHHAEMSKAEMKKLQIEMFAHTDTITRLLDQMASPSHHQSPSTHYPLSK